MSRAAWRPDGPGSFLAPDGVRAVRDRSGGVWVRRGPRWTADGKLHIRWRVLVDEYGPVTDVTPAPPALKGRRAGE